MNMNRNLILAAIVAVVVIAGYFAYVNQQISPPAAEAPKKTQQQ